MHGDFDKKKSDQTNGKGRQLEKIVKMQNATENNAISVFWLNQK